MRPFPPHSPLPSLLPAVRFLRLPVAGLVAAGIVGTVAAVAVGQGDDARFSNWTKVESAPETRTYKEAMRGGSAFDAVAKTFLEEVALPQLALEANRGTIERVRKRMREFLLADIANEKTVEDASRTVLTFMESLVGNQDADAVVRVNAMLLIGEMQAPAPERKPWQPAASVLAKAVANPELPKSLRIAACVGLARHVEATKGVAEEQQRMAAVAGPAIMAILKEFAAEGPKEPPKEPASSAGSVENDWMVSRCLSMLPLLGPLSPAAAAEVVRILNEGSRSINVRVRAAATLAAAAGPDSKVDKAAAIKSVGALATSALERDVAAGDKLALDRQYSGAAGQPGAPGVPLDPAGQPVVEPLIPREICRRAAWRLAVLADAILTDDSKRGLAVLGGEASPPAVELAQGLRRAAMDLDATPEENTLRQALTALKPAQPAAPAAGDAPASPTDKPAAAPAAKEPA